MAHRLAILSLLTILIFAPASSQLILIGRNQEIEIGKEVAAALEKQYGVWDDPEQTRRIERIGKSLVAVCERKDMPYTFKILNERKELNAMAAPGGFIYITRALLEALESDDEVAFVLGHEIGHVAGDHIRKQLSQAIAGSILLDILTGGSSQIVRIGTNIMFSLYQSGYSRQHERDADTRGVRYMKAAGYNPVAAITALKKLGMERYKGLVRWFGTHPDIPSRFSELPICSALTQRHCNRCLKAQKAAPFPKGQQRCFSSPKTQFSACLQTLHNRRRFGNWKTGGWKGFKPPLTGKLCGCWSDAKAQS